MIGMLMYLALEIWICWEEGTMVWYKLAWSVGPQRLLRWRLVARPLDCFPSSSASRKQNIPVI